MIEQAGRIKNEVWIEERVKLAAAKRTKFGVSKARCTPQGKLTSAIYATVSQKARAWTKYIEKS
jgi:hypothetical protein